MLNDFMGGLRPVILSDRNPGLISGVEQVFGKEFHSYCLRHLTKNFLNRAGKLGIRREATREVVKQMFNRTAYATTSLEYTAALDDLRSYKSELATWVEANEPGQWAASKFTKERWGKMNNNTIESWNNWMRELRPLPILGLVYGHLEKLGRKMNSHKDDIERCSNGVGSKIEKRLQATYDNLGSVIAIQCYNNSLKEYGVQLTNSRRLVIKLNEMTCSCKQWQTQGLPCCHAIAVIEREHLWVYDYVHPCYKAPAQHLIYTDCVHPIETLDMATVNDSTGIVYGEDLAQEFNRRILPPINGRQPGRPQVRRRESQHQGTKVRRCSKCLEGGHSRRTCKNPRADVDANYEGDLFSIEDLLGGGSGSYNSNQAL